MHHQIQHGDDALHGAGNDHDALAKNLSEGDNDDHKSNHVRSASRVSSVPLSPISGRVRVISDDGLQFEVDEGPAVVPKSYSKGDYELLGTGLVDLDSPSASANADDLEPQEATTASKDDLDWLDESSL